MGTVTLLGLAGAVLALATFAQWVLLRARYLEALTQQRTRHGEQMQSASRFIEQAKRQVGQLQLELGHTRSQLAHLASRAALAEASRQAEAALQVARHEASAAACGHAQTADGFADTLPAPQYPHDVTLLATYPRRRRA